MMTEAQSSRLAAIRGTVHHVYDCVSHTMEGDNLRVRVLGSRKVRGDFTIAPNGSQI